MIPEGVDFDYPAANELFGKKEHLCLEWLPGNPMPPDLPQRIANEMGLGKDGLDLASIDLASKDGLDLASIEMNIRQEESKEEKRKKLTSIFNFVDSDGGGQITVKEIFRWGLTIRGTPYTPNEMKRITNAYDINGDGVITLDEWLEYHETTHRHDTEVDGFGIIDAETLKSASKLSKDIRKAVPDPKFTPPKFTRQHTFYNDSTSGRHVHKPRAKRNHGSSSHGTSSDALSLSSGLEESEDTRLAGDV